jgi:hypothetical protein
LPGLNFITTCTTITKQPNGQSCSDGMRPDGLTLARWAQGIPLIWARLCDLYFRSFIHSRNISDRRLSRSAGCSMQGSYIFELSKYTYRNSWTHELHCCHSFVRSGSQNHSQDKWKTCVKPVTLFNVFRSMFNVSITSWSTNLLFQLTTMQENAVTIVFL